MALIAASANTFRYDFVSKYFSKISFASAFGNVPVDLAVGLVFEFTIAKVRDLLAVIESSAFTLWSVAYRTILSEK